MAARHVAVVGPPGSLRDDLVQALGPDGDLVTRGLAEVAGLPTRALTHVIVVAPLAAGFVGDEDFEGVALEVVSRARELPALERLTVVSSVHVFGLLDGRVAEEPAPADDETPVLRPAERVLARAEAVFREAAGALPVIVCRAGTVLGRSRPLAYTPWTPYLDLVAEFFGGRIGFAYAPADGRIDVVPSEYVAHAAAALALERGEPGGIYHLAAGPRALPVMAFFDGLHAALRAHSKEFRRRGVGVPLACEARPLVDVLSTSIADLGLPAVAANVRRPLEFKPSQEVATERAAAALAPLAIAPPSFADYVGAFVEGLLPALERMELGAAGEPSCRTA